MEITGIIFVIYIAVAVYGIYWAISFGGNKELRGLVKRKSSRIKDGRYLGPSCRRDIMKTFRIKTIEKEYTEREYYVDAETMAEAIDRFSLALKYERHDEYLSDSSRDFELEYVDSICETAPDGNELPPCNSVE